MKKICIILICLLLLCACAEENSEIEAKEKIDWSEACKIMLSDDQITVDGEVISLESTEGIYQANDIVYYEAGRDFTYGEGTEDESHSEKEAKEHTVVHITEPGMYELSGHLSKGQIAIDLGEGAKNDPDAVVTLVMNNVDINCDVAPAIIFYEVYECGNKDEKKAGNTVDTAAAGANVYIPDGTVNKVTGSHVAKIYESYELNEDGTEVVDSKKLHKYDAAFYSKMTMNVDGAVNGSGTLNILADNEGLDSELHLTINGGNINIESGNDGINTNEDYISVTTINDGSVKINVTGETGEGDGIDSNGWLVINGGVVIAEACSKSGDAGIDSDMGIHINGGTVCATGNMLDRIDESEQIYVVMNFSESQKAGSTYELKNKSEEITAACSPQNDFMYMLLSNEKMTEGTYTFWQDDKQLSAMNGQSMGGHKNMQKPEGEEIPEKPEVEKSEGGKIPPKPEGEKPEDGKIPQKPEGEMPEDMKRPEKGMQPGGDISKEFAILSGGNYYSNVVSKEE